MCKNEYDIAFAENRPPPQQEIREGVRQLELQSERAALPTIDSMQSVYKAMACFAETCIARGMTQSAADILAFLRLQPDLNADLLDCAEEMFADLESRVCPRVILDAREFAAELDRRTMIEYLLDVAQTQPN